MSWIRTKTEQHQCPLPDCSFRDGDLWRCADMGGCGQLWRVGMACEWCDRHNGWQGIHQGGHVMGLKWRPATLRQRIKHRWDGWEPYWVDEPAEEPTP